MIRKGQCRAYKAGLFFIVLRFNSAGPAGSTVAVAAVQNAIITMRNCIYGNYDEKEDNAAYN
jgi:hypothetical protein